MVFEFKFPDVGEGIHEGKLVKWHVQEGDNVNHDQILCEVETDKAVVEIPSPKTSKILKLHGKEGEIIHVGDTLVTFEADDEPSENKNKVVAMGTSPDIIAASIEAFQEGYNLLAFKNQRKE